jgi:hypothetical protein
MTPLHPAAWHRASWAAKARRHAQALATVTRLELEHAARFDRSPHDRHDGAHTARRGVLNVSHSS